MLYTTYTNSDANVPVTQDKYALGGGIFAPVRSGTQAVNCGSLSQCYT
jgi:hypothetical protein